MDGRPLQGASSVRGIGSYERGLLAGLAELASRRRSACCCPPTGAAGRGTQRFGLRRGVSRSSTHAATGGRHGVRRARASGFAADLYHAVEFGQPLRTRLPVVVTVHDLIPSSCRATTPGCASPDSRTAAASPRRRGDRRVRGDAPRRAAFDGDDPERSRSSPRASHRCSGPHPATTVHQLRNSFVSSAVSACGRHLRSPQARRVARRRGPARAAGPRRRARHRGRPGNVRGARTGALDRAGSLTTAE